MINGLVSIIIPARNEKFLYQTLNDILQHATGPIEVIVILDGYWCPANEFLQDDRVHYLHRGKAQGMRDGINSAVSISKGEYILKLDAHCMLDQGFDEKLKSDCEANWIVVPRRKRLDAANWTIQEVGKPDVDYEYIGYPGDPEVTGGIKGQIWTQRIIDRKDILIDENMTFQGSCYFMKRSHWDWLGGLNPQGYGQFVREAQELCLKTWLGGGKVMTNKKTWYAHLHKGKTYGRMYPLDKRETTAGDRYCDDYWWNNRWQERKHDLSWLIERFAPVPTWPADRSLWTPQLQRETSNSVAIPNINTPLDYIFNTYKLDSNLPSPIEIPNTNRDTLASLFAELGFMVGVELGVERGLFSEVLCQANPKLKLYSIDAWAAYKGYREHVSQDKIDAIYQDAIQRLKPYNCELIKAYSCDAVRQFDDHSLDFVYIDGNHSFGNTAFDIEVWSRKVKKGGIIAGHDYIRRSDPGFNGVVDAVNTFTTIYKIAPWFVLGRKETIPGELRDKSRSFFWIKA